MKSILIFILLLALAGAFVLTRPNEEDFKRYIAQKAVTGNMLDLTILLGDITYHNYVLWTTVQKEGQTIYVGALSHWIERNKLPGKQQGESSSSSPTVTGGKVPSGRGIVNPPAVQ